MHPPGRSAEKKSTENSLRLPVLALCCALLLAGCHVLSARRTLGQARQELARAEQIDLAGESLYHRAMAKELMEAAEKQYEDADFSEATRFAREALEHLSRIPGESARGSGDSPSGGMSEAGP